MVVHDLKPKKCDLKTTFLPLYDSKKATFYPPKSHFSYPKKPPGNFLLLGKSWVEFWFFDAPAVNNAEYSE